MKSSSAILSLMFLPVVLVLNPAETGTQRVNPISPLNSNLVQDQSPRQREYRFTQQALGITKDGVMACFICYESSDGVRVFTRTEYFRSNHEMETHFEAKTKSFVEIVERSEIESAKSDLKVQRVAGKHLPNEQGLVTYSIMWNEAISIKYIESTSLIHALEFEKRFYRSEK